MEEQRVIHEITPLMSSDAFYIADRRKETFTYPIHNHEVFELNFVENAAGVRRIVGDSTEIIGDRDLVLITNPYLEHAWEQNACTSKDIHEITVQFKMDLSDDGMLARKPFVPLTRMLQRARNGLVFSAEAIDRVYDQLVTLSHVGEGFYAFVQFLTILYELAKFQDTRQLSSDSYARVEERSDSRRVLKVKKFIADHFKDELHLAELSGIAGMSPSAFSRFFKLHTGRNVSEYLIDIRLGYASRKLVDSTDSVSEICFGSGFNNLSNFNRMFRKKKGCSPTEFRDNFRKTRIIV